MLTPDYSMYNRRHFLKHMAGMSLMALPGLRFVEGLRANEKGALKNKSIIVLWMSGGPTHMDTWDLKPGEDTGGELKPIKTAASGVQISELLPKVASQMKHLSIIRSLVSNEGSHERGRVLLHTGRQPSPIVNWPSIGAVASHQLTPKELDLPGFIAVGRPADGPGFLGMNYAPFTVQNPGAPPENIAPPSQLAGDLERMKRRERLFKGVEASFQDRLHPDLLRLPNPKAREVERKKLADAAQAHNEIYGKAFSLVVSERRKVFDLSSEPSSLVNEYGNNNFGKGCLLARKLVEAGVTCVEVDLGGWDMHNNIFTALRSRLPMLDQGMATLTKDLNQRGLLKNTVVVWMGEFGRTPRINQNAGRDHWGRCWSVVVGGGTIKGGQVYGSTDKDGTSVKDNPVSVADLFATLYKGMGLDPNTQIRDNLGRPHSISGENAKAIKELVG